MSEIISNYDDIISNNNVTSKISEFKEFKIEPQLLLLFDQNKYIERVIFFTVSYVLDTESWVFNMYKILKETQGNIFLTEDYEIINTHILLTYNIDQTKGFINNLLNLDSIILFSLTNNIEFYYDDNNKVFNPFIQETNTNLKIRNEYEYLYQFYPEAVSKFIVCVIRQNDDSMYPIIKNYGSFGKYCPEFTTYTDGIMNNIVKNKYKIKRDHNILTGLNTDIPFVLITNLLNDNNYHVEYNRINNDSIIIAGSIKLLEMIDNISVYVYLKKIEKNPSDPNNQIEVLKPIFYYEKIINIIDFKLWEKIPQGYLSSLQIKGKQENYKSIITFDTKLQFILDIDINFNFIIKPTEKTKNIYTDISGKINIIASNDHINFRYKIDYPGIPEYLTVLILGYSHINSGLKNLNKNVKINNIYVSRLCQNSKTILRKPVATSEITDMDNYHKLSDSFLQGKEISLDEMVNDKISQKIVKLSDVYINEEGIYYKCPKDNMFIGFIDNIYNYSKMCVPCCYYQSKQATMVFKKCVYETEISSSSKVSSISKVSPFVRVNKDNKLKTIFRNNQLGDLGKDYNKLFNHKIEDSSKPEPYIKYNINRIVSAKNYVMYKKYNYGEDINNYDELMKFIHNYYFTHKRRIILIEDTDFFVDIIDDSELYDVFILINKKIHVLVSINKEEEKDKIKHSNIDIDIIKYILKVYKSTFSNELIKYKSNTIIKKINFNYNNLYINDIIYNFDKINFFIKYNLINNDIKEFKHDYNILNIKTNNEKIYADTCYINQINS